MKKFIGAVLMAVMVMVMTVSAEAATKLLPKGAKVSASISADGIAEISVSGVDDLNGMEIYSYEGIKEINGPKATIDLREGRRFQVVFGGGLYSLLTPEMAAIPQPDFFGPGVGLDCTNQEGGCCFIVTGGK